MRRAFKLLLALWLLCTFPIAALAATIVADPVTGDAVWTKEGSPYVVYYATVPMGSSLTVLPGTVVKIYPGAIFSVSGSLHAGAPDAVEQVIFTSLRDDTAGGDTNEDGAATTPSAGDWRNITVELGGSVTIENAAIRYGGAAAGYDFVCFAYCGFTYFSDSQLFNHGGELNVGTTTFTESAHTHVEQTAGLTHIADSDLIGAALAVRGKGGSLTLSRNYFSSNTAGFNVVRTALYLAGNAFAGTPENEVDPYSTYVSDGRNTVAEGESAILRMGGIAADVARTLPREGFVYVLGGTIASGGSLTIAPGAVMKMHPGGQLLVLGSLTAGDSASPLWTLITSFNDDTVGGDTNADDAATSPAVGDWGNITVATGGVAAFHHTAFRYGGARTNYAYRCDFGLCGYFAVTQSQLLNFGGTLMVDDGRFTSAPTHVDTNGGATTLVDTDFTGTTDGVQNVIAGSLDMEGSSIDDILLGSTGLNVRSGASATVVGNWWGSANGPTHPGNIGGDGAVIDGDASYTPWLSEAPDLEAPVFVQPATTTLRAPIATTPPACTENCNSNVLFLPGLQASRLYEPTPCDEYGCTWRLWEPAGDVLVRELFLTEDGTSTNEGVHTSDVVDEAFGFGPNIYETFIDSMNELRSEGTIEDWAATPYDWRFSPQEILRRGIPLPNGISYLTPTESPYILGQLKRLAASSRTGRVTIVAHSYGGIIAKELLRELGDEEAARFVDRLILVASPQTGTPQAMGGLLHGFDQGIPAGAPLLLHESTARELGENMPSAYYLLPTARYFADVGTPLATFANASPVLTHAYDWYGGFLNSVTEMRDFLLGVEGRIEPAEEDTLTPNVLNAMMLADAGATHATLDAWTPPAGIEVLQIAGWGIDTLAGLSYSQKKRGDTYSWQFEPMLVEDGDGTVVVPSALAMDSAPENITNWWVNLQDYDSLTRTGRSHPDILEVEGVRSIIRNTLTNTGAGLPSYISLTTPPQNDEEKKLRFFLHSPLSLHLYDGEGNHTGISTTTGTIEHGISGAYYREFGEVKYITVSTSLASTTLRLVLDGEASGFFDLKIEEVEGDTVVATTTFVDVPTSTSTLVTMEFTDGTIAGAGALAVDEDGNGTTDFSLAPKEGEVVTLPPPSPTYNFNGFLQPVNDTTYHPEQAPSVFKGGSTIPVKFQIKDGAGTPIQATTTPLWLTPERDFPMSAAIGESTYSLGSTNGNTFRWDATNEQYIYHWSTKGVTAGYWYRVFAKLDDGKTYSVTVGLR